MAARYPHCGTTLPIFNLSRVYLKHILLWFRHPLAHFTFRPNCKLPSFYWEILIDEWLSDRRKFESCARSCRALVERRMNEWTTEWATRLNGWDEKRTKYLSKRITGSMRWNYWVEVYLILYPFSSSDSMAMYWRFVEGVEFILKSNKNV